LVAFGLCDPVLAPAGVIMVPALVVRVVERWIVAIRHSRTGGPGCCATSSGSMSTLRSGTPPRWQPS
ncbi:hypothetical protein, partial [Pseudonocardia aurantiaca]